MAARRLHQRSRGQQADGVLAPGADGEEMIVAERRALHVRSTRISTGFASVFRRSPGVEIETEPGSVASA